MIIFSNQVQYVALGFSFVFHISHNQLYWNINVEWKDPANERGKTHSYYSGRSAKNVLDAATPLGSDKQISPLVVKNQTLTPDFDPSKHAKWSFQFIKWCLLFLLCASLYAATESKTVIQYSRLFSMGHI